MGARRFAGFIAESAAAQIPDEQGARAEYAAALASVDTATSDADLATAPKRLARTATQLARALSRT